VISLTVGQFDRLTVLVLKRSNAFRFNA